MSRGSRKNGKKRGRGSGTGTMVYVDGNTLRKLDVYPERSRRRKERQERQSVRNEAAVQQRHISPGYVFFLLLALSVTASICIAYIDVRARITTSQREIASLEKQLSELKLANDEEYDRIMGDVDLEEIKRIAMNELGMKYPNENQVVHIDKGGDDYVRQFGDIPEN